MNLKLYVNIIKGVVIGKVILKNYMIILMKIVYMRKSLVNIKIVMSKFKEKKKKTMKLIVRIDLLYVHIVKKQLYLNLSKIILIYVKK